VGSNSGDILEMYGSFFNKAQEEVQTQGKYMRIGESYEVFTW